MISSQFLHFVQRPSGIWTFFDSAWAEIGAFDFLNQAICYLAIIGCRIQKMNRSLPPGIQRRNCGFVINILTGTSGLSSSFVSKKRHGLSFRIQGNA
jgi:hypothetical protein